jgi:hypothetical protein
MSTFDSAVRRIPSWIPVLQICQTLLILTNPPIHRPPCYLQQRLCRCLYLRFRSHLWPRRSRSQSL